MRAVATAAGVDPALLHHYLGARDQLFLTAVRTPVAPGDIISTWSPRASTSAGSAWSTPSSRVWGSPAGSAVDDDRSALLLRGFLVTQVLRRVAEVLELPEAPRRLPLVASQFLGLAMTRCLLCVEPVAGAPRSG